MERPPAFDRLGPELEAELKRRVGDGSSPLHGMLRYHLGWTDERGLPQRGPEADRTYGTLCLLAAEAAGGDARRALPAAAGVEMAAGFALVHEELRLGLPNRQERPALWWVWGHAQGINAGDGLYALARLAVMDLARTGVAPQEVLRAVQALDKACLELCERRSREIDLEAQSALTAQEYLWGIEGEEGALTGAAAAVGALAAAAPEPTVEAFKSFGRWTGAAHRLRRDMDALWGDAPGSASGVVDLLDQRRSLPLLYALQYLTGPDRRALEALAARDKPIQDKDVKELLGLLERSGALAFTEATRQRCLSEALEALRGSRVPPSSAAELEAMAWYVAQPHGTTRT